MNVPRELTKDEQLLQVWVRLDAALAAQPGLLENLLREARQWLETWREEQRIVDSSLDEALFRKVCQTLEKGYSGSIRLRLAQGWPSLPGLDIRASERKAMHISVAMRASGKGSRQWPYSWLEARVNAEAERIFPRMQLVNSTRLFEYWVKHFHGLDHEDQIELAVTKPSLRAAHFTQAIMLHVDEQRGIVELVIHDSRAARDPEQLQKLEDEAKKKLNQLQNDKPIHRGFLLWKQAEERLSVLLAGPAALGLGLPIRLLVGFVHRVDLSLENEGAQAFKTWFDATVSGLSASTDWMAKFRHEAAGQPTVPHTDFLMKFYHALALDALRKTPAHERVMATTHVALSPAQLPLAKKLLLELRSGSGAQENPDAAARPYHFLLHFFPIATLKAKAKVEDAAAADHPWLSTVVREMTQLAEFFFDAAWVRERLIPGVAPAELEQVLQQLKKLGFIIFQSAQKKWVRGGSGPLPPTSLPAEKALQVYESLVRLSDEILSSVPPMARQRQSSTLLLDAKSFDSFKNQIEECCQRLPPPVAEAPKAAVYTLLIGLFPAAGPR